MDIRFKTYQKNGSVIFIESSQSSLLPAISQAVFIIQTHDLKKIDIYADTKLKATIYG